MDCADIIVRIDEKKLDTSEIDKMLKMLIIIHKGDSWTGDNK